MELNKKGYSFYLLSLKPSLYIPRSSLRRDETGGFDGDLNFHFITSEAFVDCRKSTFSSH